MAFSTLENYARRYPHLTMDRRDGILQLTLHSEGAALRWGAHVHEELSYAFNDIARDHDNGCVILTGAGDAFCAEMDTSGGPGGLAVELGGAPRSRASESASCVKIGPAPAPALASTTWDRIYSDAKYLLTNLLNIEVPMIAAVNGPALIHAELAVMCDVVLASDTAVFQDAPHFPNGVVPGDGVHLIWPLLLGPNRGRYFLLTGHKIDAAEALKLGVVSEVMPQAQLLPRAYQLAQMIIARPSLAVRYARVAMTQQLKKLMLENLGYGLALEGLSAAASWPGAKG